MDAETERLHYEQAIYEAEKRLRELNNEAEIIEEEASLLSKRLWCSKNWLDLLSLEEKRLGRQTSGVTMILDDELQGAF